SGAELSELGSLIESGKLKVILDRTFPFAQISEALAYVESGRAKGKVVVSMDA
ncbi:MAG: NADP-dependent oxidoreductase, partial [Afipia sp.]